MQHAIRLLPSGLVLWFSLALGVSGCQHATPAVTPPPAPVVTVSQPIARQVLDYEDFTGRTAAVSAVDIRARVSGYLVKVHFKDGEIVKQGELLYEIDARPFQIELEQAKGQVERLEAQKKLMDIQVARYTELRKQNATTQQDLDQYLAQQAETAGSLRTAQADVGHAALNLDFTRVTAPITGQISRTLLTAGNLVNADQTLLTTLMSIDPMYAYFSVEEPTVLRIRKMVRDGVIQSRDVRKVEVLMGLADDREHKFPLRGKLDFTNNTIDPQTGTMLVRGVFANPYKEHEQPAVLTPGLFVRVRLPVGLPHRSLLVAERAIGTDQGQKFVYVVDENQKVVYRRVKLGLVFDGLQAIEEGLQPGDRVVVNGLQRVRPGIEVSPEPVDMASLAGPGQPEAKPDAAKPASDQPKAAKPPAAAPAAAPAPPKS